MDPEYPALVLQVIPLRVGVEQPPVIAEHDAMVALERVYPSCEAGKVQSTANKHNILSRVNLVI